VERPIESFEIRPILDLRSSPLPSSGGSLFHAIISFEGSPITRCIRLFHSTPFTCTCFPFDFLSSICYATAIHSHHSLSMVTLPLSFHFIKQHPPSFQNRTQTASFTYKTHSCKLSNTKCRIRNYILNKAGKSPLINDQKVSHSSCWCYGVY
jgi:hypothetical protein